MTITKIDKYYINPDNVLYLNDTSAGKNPATEIHLVGDGTLTINQDAAKIATALNGGGSV